MSRHPDPSAGPVEKRGYLWTWLMSPCVATWGSAPGETFGRVTLWVDHGEQEPPSVGDTGGVGVARVFALFERFRSSKARPFSRGAGMRGFASRGAKWALRTRREGHIGGTGARRLVVSRKGCRA